MFNVFFFHPSVEGERDFNKDPGTNRPFRFEGQVYSLCLQGVCFYISVIRLSFPTDFREIISFGYSVRLGVRQNIQMGMLFQDQQNML